MSSAGSGRASGAWATTTTAATSTACCSVAARSWLSVYRRSCSWRSGTTATAAPSGSCASSVAATCLRWLLLAVSGCHMRSSSSRHLLVMMLLLALPLVLLLALRHIMMMRLRESHGRGLHHGPSDSVQDSLLCDQVQRLQISRLVKALHRALATHAAAVASACCCTADAG